MLCYKIKQNLIFIIKKFQAKNKPFIKKVPQVHHLQHLVSFRTLSFRRNVLIHAHHPQIPPHNPSPNHPTSLLR